MAISLVDLLERSVEAWPDRPAVASPGVPALTYRELEQRSARIAGALAGLGVGRSDRVGLLVPKSVEVITGVWGAMRSGAAYVPIDPMAPARRAALIAASCGMKVVLASGDLPEAVDEVRRAVPGIQVLQIHGSESLEGAGRLEDFAAPGGVRSQPVNVRDLAYILYTSGSTGMPKGVMVSHAASLAFVEWAVWRLGVRPDDVLSNHAPLHFDLSTFDLFAAAAAGAKLVVLDEETVRFPAAAAHVLESEKITVWYSVPSALRTMLRLGGLAQRDLSALRTLLFAGEVYPAGELRALQAALPQHIRLFNLYGPTETNVCTYWPVPPAGSWDHTAIPIGIDCESCQGVVVDESLAPVPDGTPGELLMRGGTLMEGYWNDPERSAASFVPNFLQPHLGDRFYRTGDIVTRQADGTYAFHGRKDHMVKVRGHRIELGEVETALHAAAGVADAAVVAVQRMTDGGTETELVAFLVGESGSPGDLGEAARGLRRHLGGVLPRYMVPAEFRWTSSLPRTPNGKVDRQTLAGIAAAGEVPA